MLHRTIYVCIIILMSFFGFPSYANTGEAGVNREVIIELKPVFKNFKLELGTKKYTSSTGDTLQVDQFRFYVSAFELVFANGTIYTEQESYHLIDAEIDSSLQFSLKNVPAGEILEVRFQVGVDSVKCMSGAFGGDLDPSNGMYWAWNSGYIHAKLEGKSKSCKTHQNVFEFHVGGFAYPHNAVRKVSLQLGNEYQKADKLIILADAHVWLQDTKLAEINSVVIPGKQAMKVADNYIKMFKLMY